MNRTCGTCEHRDVALNVAPCRGCFGTDAKAGWELVQLHGRVPVVSAMPPEVPAQAETIGGTKHDQDKPRMDLLDPLWLEETAKVLGFGAQKYAAHNWRQGIAQSRLIGAALRHLTAHQRGEDRDPESGLPHLAHASCCLMFLTNMAATRPDLDDRYKAPATA